MSSAHPRTHRRLVLAALVAVLAALVAPAASAGERHATGSPAPIGLERAHAHNDYEHDRPLADALDHGFKSVEADVWLVDGKLMVAHDRHEVRPGVTLESLYLAPLRRIVRGNHGSVYPGDPDYFTLLIDFKSAAPATYRELRERLREYQRMLTTYGPEGVRDGAVTVILSGTMSADEDAQRTVARQRVRYVAIDGRLDDLGTGVSATLVPLISSDWGDTFTWTGVGPMPEEERRTLHRIVRTAHENGQRVRFWDTPDDALRREAVWDELLEARVDYVNTDHLDALQDYLLEHDPQPTEPYVSWRSGERPAAA